VNQHLQTLLSTKCTPTAKLVALHLAAKLPVSPEPIQSTPRHEAIAIGVSRSDYERGWSECIKLGWLTGRSPCWLSMPVGALPRAALGLTTTSPTAAKPSKKAPAAPKRESNE
jgi:hypothetical protein